MCNKRRRWKVKRNRRANRFRDMYNRPWAYGKSMYMVRRKAAMALIAMGLSGLTAWGCTNPVGPSSFTCLTQPRLYYNPSTGESRYEVDHYEQATPCPKEPIQ